MSLKGIAKQTVSIQDAGAYINDAGQKVEFGDAQHDAVAGTLLYTPESLAELEWPVETGASTTIRIDVTSESTQSAARRLVVEEQLADLVVLNFASARNVCGGFMKGAKAQEEDVARSSGIYRCLETVPEFYRVNREQTSLLYTDHMVYSPYVPWFRVKNRALLPDFYLASILTAPAPNAGEYLRRNPDGEAEVLDALRRRAAHVLNVARHQGHRNLLLGAWGCGVFRNDPASVASAFGDLLEGRFAADFDRVVFAVYDKSKTQNVLSAFQARLGTSM